MAALTSIVLVVAASTAAAQEGYLDTTIEVHNTQAPDGGIFHVTGRSSCTLTDVTLKYRRYDGDVDIATEQAKTKDRPDGRVDYTIDFIVPFNAQPGLGKLFADARCGDPNAAPSNEVEVTITKASMTLSATPAKVAPGQVVTVSGDRCYGDDDGKVTIKASGVLSGQTQATLTQQRFTAKFTAPRTLGTVTFTVGGGDCSGSNGATARATVAKPTSTPPPHVSSTPVTTPSPKPSSTASPSASVTPTATTSPSTTSPVTEPPLRKSSSGWRVWPLLVVVGAAALGLLAWQWRRRGARP